MPNSLYDALCDLMTKEFGDVGRFIVKRQCEKLGFEPLNLKHEHLPRLSRALIDAASVFTTPEKASSLYRAINRLKNLDNIVEEEKDVEKKAEMYVHLAEAAKTAGDLRSAEKYYTHLLTDAKAKEDKKAEGQQLMNLGYVKRMSGEWEKALDYYNRALKIFASLGDRKNKAQALQGIGYVHWRLGDLQKALECYDKGLEECKAINDIEGLSLIYIDYGNLFGDKGEYGAAIYYLNKSLELLEKTDKDFEKVRVLNNLGENYKLQEKWDEAIKCFNMQIKIAEEKGFTRWKAWALFTMGECYARMGNTEKALKVCKEAEEILTKLGDDIAIAAVHRDYGIIYRLMEEWKKSDEHFKKSIEFYEKLNIPYYHAYAYYEYALMLWEKGDEKGAKECAEKALSLSKKVGAKKQIEKIKKLLAKIPI